MSLSMVALEHPSSYKSSLPLPGKVQVERGIRSGSVLVCSDSDRNLLWTPIQSVSTP